MNQSMTYLYRLAILCSTFPLSFGCCGQCEDFSISVSAGTWPTEVSWTLLDENDGIVLNGFAPYTGTICLDPGCYTLLMSDSYGDGWNGATMTISDASGFVQGSATLATGYNGNQLLQLGVFNCNGNDVCSDYEISVFGGDFQDDVTWALIDNAGIVVATGGAPFSEVLCLLPGCYELSMLDATGDGWQGTYFTMINQSTGETEQQFSLTWGFSGMQEIALGEAACSNISTADCIGGSAVCQGVYSFDGAPIGSGFFPFEMSASGCNPDEVNSAWFTFTVQTAGVLRFELIPNDPYDDYDWSLFDITNGGCQSGGTYPLYEASCNSYGLFGGIQGSTGISSLQGGFGNSNGPGDLNGPPFNGDLPVSVGQAYALVVMNWSNSLAGYTLDFSSSTADIFDDVPPTISSITSSCEGPEFIIEMSEPVRCGSLQPLDFVVTNQDGDSFFPTEVSGSECELGGVASAVITLTFEPPLDVDVYTVGLTNLASGVSDPCDNIATGEASCSSVFLSSKQLNMNCSSTHNQVDVSLELLGSVEGELVEISMLDLNQSNHILVESFTLSEPQQSQTTLSATYERQVFHDVLRAQWKATDGEVIRESYCWINEGVDEGTIWLTSNGTDIHVEGFTMGSMVSVFGLNGQVVREPIEITDQFLRISTQTWSTGVYFVVVTGKENKAVKVHLNR